MTQKQSSRTPKLGAPYQEQKPRGKLRHKYLSTILST